MHETSRQNEFQGEKLFTELHFFGADSPREKVHAFLTAALRFGSLDQRKIILHLH